MRNFDAKTAKARKQSHLGMEEYLWSEESLVSNIDSEWLLSDGIDSIIRLQPFRSVGVILREFLEYVRADIAVSLLDTLRHFVTLLCGDSRFSISQERLHEVSDVSSS